ncbi:hypothetical protein BMR03_14440, partial [Methylococcaceae bacterium HT2]
KQTINNNGFPDKGVMDKSGANYAGLANINLLLILAGFTTMIISVPLSTVPSELTWQQAH